MSIYDIQMIHGNDIPEDLGVRKTRPNPDRLADDHFIDWLVEAKQLYQHERPPFVEKNQGGSRAGLRKNVTLRVTDDKQQGLPVEAELICWSWSPQYTFFTIDIGGRRLIVKGNSSDRYCSYRSWLGPKTGFSYQPVAFGPWQKDSEDFDRPVLDLKTQHANHVRRLSTTPSPGSPAKPDDRAQSMKNQYTPQPEWRTSKFCPINSLIPSSASQARPANSNPEFPIRQQYVQEQQPYVASGHTARAASRSVQSSPRPIKARKGEVQVSPATIHSDSQHYALAPNQRPPSLEPRPDASPPKRGEDHSPSGPGNPAQVSQSQAVPKVFSESQDDQALTPKPDKNSTTGTRRQHYASAERTGERANSSKPYGDSVDAPTAHGSQYHGHVSTESNPQPRPTKRRRQISVSNPLNPTSPQLPTAMRSPSARSSPRPTPSTSSQDHSRFSTPPSSIPQSTDPSSLSLSLSSSSSSPSPLAPHKQSHTTLFIAIPLSTDTVPLKLRSCMTLSSLFASVLAICAQPGQHAVSGIRATFDWKLDRDVDRAILLKLDFPDTFEVFLEIVDGAPCWGEQGGGRCGVGVEVVLV